MSLNYPLTNKKIFGQFIERKNRFVVTASVGGKIVECYLPNSGKLWELLIPRQTELMVIKNPNHQSLPYTVLACKKKNQWVLLHTHLTNKIVRFLINQKIIYKNFSVVSEEIKVFNSRFDLLLENNKERLYLEVKTCSLFGERVAMFPDAVTERGRKHLIELKNLAQNGFKTSVLFVVMSPEVDFFLPGYHIDYEFSKTFMDIKDFVDIKGIALGWDDALTEIRIVKELKIPFSFIEKILKEGGVYLLVCFLEKPMSIPIGSIGKVDFQAGYYVYVGKSKRGLFKRVLRHKRKRLKKLHWHIDYFLKEAKLIVDLPIVTDQEIECYLAEKISKISDGIIHDFGSSDCNCLSHLFYFKENPMSKKAFIETVTFLRLSVSVPKEI